MARSITRCLLRWQVDHISAVRLGMAYLLFSPLIPAATITTLANSAIEWSGVQFHVEDGRVSAMYRKNAKGEWYTVPSARSIETTMKELAEFQLAQDGLLQ